MMRPTFSFAILLMITLVLLFTGCQHQEKKGAVRMTDETRAEVSMALEQVVLKFLYSWEPPYYPDSALALFTQTEDFSLVIDGWYTGSYEEWAAGVPNYMSDDAFYFTSYKHEVQEFNTVPLSPESGVVTIVYIWDHVNRDGIHGRTDGRATLACRKEAGGWKIVHYHGSHHEMPPLE